MSKISDLDKSTVKMLFRIIISELLYLKDFYTFNLDCKIGIISITKDEISFRAFDVAIPSTPDVSTVSNLHSLHISLNSNSGRSIRSASTNYTSPMNMTAVDKLLLGDYEVRRIRQREKKMNKSGMAFYGSNNVNTKPKKVF